MKAFVCIALAGMAILAAPGTAEAQTPGDRVANNNERRQFFRSPDRGTTPRDHQRQQDEEWRRHLAEEELRRNQVAAPAAEWDPENPDWWRGREDFNGYQGPRRGRYFAPDYGYYRIEDRHEGYRWQEGDFLPYAYRVYYVREPEVYSLNAAPPGYRWTHAGSDIVLVALDTGLITGVLQNVY